MTIQRAYLLISLVTGLAFTSFAEPAKSPVGLHTGVAEVTDNRTTGQFNSECKLDLVFTGDAAADATTVHKITITKALDELGRDLTLTEENSSSTRSANAQRNRSALKAALKLRNPSRNAAVIKVVEGQVEFFSPTPGNGGILVIKDILKRPAEPVQNATLKKYGIELMYLTKESYEAKQKELEQNKDAGNAMGEAFGELFKGMFGSLGGDSANSVKLFVKDPQDRVVNVEFQNAKGEPLKRRSSWSSGGIRNQSFDAPPPADTQLEIQLATAEATQSFPFKVENIPLP